MVRTGKIHVEIFTTSREGIDFDMKSGSYIVIHDDKIVDYKITFGILYQSKLPTDFKISRIGRHCYKVILRVTNFDCHLKADIPYLTYLMIKWAKKEFWIQDKKNINKLIFILIGALIATGFTFMCQRIEAKYFPNKTPSDTPIRTHIKNSESVSSPSLSFSSFSFIMNDLTIKI